MPWFDLGLIMGLVLLNAAFAGTEIALLTLRESQVARLAQRGRAGAVLARLVGDPNRFLATIQIGITLAGFLASATAAVGLAQLLEEPLEFLGGSADFVAIIIVTLILTFFTLVLGELAPKRIALQRAERWALISARPLNFLAVATRPVVWLLSFSTNLIVRLFGGDPTQSREEITLEEVRDIIAAQAAFSPEQRRVISEAVEAGERTLREVLRPRTEFTAVQGDTPAAEALDTLVEAGHSRAPVFGKNIDEVLGVVHIRDLVKASGPVSRHARPMAVFPGSVRVLEGLQRLQRDRQQMAVVVDEYGSVDGLVTLEDLIEELVGEIYDEFDRDVRGARRESDGSIVIPGGFPIHDLPDLGVELPDGEYSTVAGLILEELGHIPKAGESVTINGWMLNVEEMDNLAIASVRLMAVVRNEDESPGDD
ncbi:MAG: DUF21 domain-containing protein [Dehalococcoidia bacterium]|nr:DUF21 domain-containing protein [Dehalococcoidia bacterium]